MNFNILGIGLPQIAIVVVLSLVLFGPKQMMQYAYQAGRFLAKARAMWEEAARNMQAEIQNSGIDLNEFKEIGQGLRQDLNKAAGDVNSAVSNPLNIPAWQPGVPPSPSVFSGTGMPPMGVISTVESSVEPPIVSPPADQSGVVSSDIPAAPPAPSLNLAEADTAATADESKKYDAWLLN